MARLVEQLDLAARGEAALDALRTNSPWQLTVFRPSFLDILDTKVEGSFDCNADTTWAIKVPFVPNPDITDLIC